MKKWIQLFQLVFDRNARVAFTLQEFMHVHKDLLIVAADPRTDEMVVGFGDALVRGKIKSATGKKVRVVKGLLIESQFEGATDGIIVALLDTMKVSLRLPAFNQFSQVLDGALFKISKNLRESAPPATPIPGAVPSPYMGEQAGRPQV